VKVAVIGSGPAGISCTQGLLKRGVQVDMLDVGETLDPSRRQLIADLRTRPFADWKRAEIARITENVSFESDGVPRRRYFGSEFVFASERDRAPIELIDTNLVPTYAKGGYSTIWGASMLPVAESDIDAWPIRRNALEPYYRNLMREMPLSTAPSGIEAVFPSYRKSAELIPFPAQCEKLLARMERHRDALSGKGVLFGRSRLAVRAAGIESDGESEGGCISCGLCHYGCVPNAIYSTVEVLERLKTQPGFRYLDKTMARSVTERSDGVVIEAMAGGATMPPARYDAVFLALGALNTTRVMLDMLDLDGQDVMLLDSEKAIVPFLTSWNTPAASDERKPALPGIFFLFRGPAETDRWAHAQIYAVNDTMLTRLGIDPFGPPQWRRKLLAPLLNRVMVAWVGLHSDLSGKLAVRLNKAENRFVIRGLKSEAAAREMRRTAWKLFRLGLRFGGIFVPPAMIAGLPGASHHVGGSFPMRAAPRTRLETDIWGRPAGRRRVFAVDATILPSIPATTITLTAMANAQRIGAEAPLEFGAAP